jgi:hypothetical protein
MDQEVLKFATTLAGAWSLNDGEDVWFFDEPNPLTYPDWIMLSKMEGLTEWVKTPYLLYCPMTGKNVMKSTGFLGLVERSLSFIDNYTLEVAQLIEGKVVKVRFKRVVDVESLFKVS